MVATGRIAHYPFFGCIIDDGIDLCFWTTQTFVAVGNIQIGFGIIAIASVDSARFLDGKEYFRGFNGGGRVTRR